MSIRGAILRSALFGGALLAVAASVPAPTAGATPIRLLGITSRTIGPTASVIIEASEPAAYLTTRPDPLTVLIELRNVHAAGAANRAGDVAAGPVSGVSVEDTRAADGAVVARVRVRLSQPVPYRVRSARRAIHVEFDRREGRPVAAAAGEEGATVLQSVRTEARRDGVLVRLRGNGRLDPAAVFQAEDRPPRLVLDFVNVSAAVPAMTTVSAGPIDRIRVARHSDAPLVTRVVLELTRNVPYRLEAAEEGRDVLVMFPAGEAATEEGTELVAGPDLELALSRASGRAAAEALPGESPLAAGSIAALMPLAGAPLGTAAPGDAGDAGQVPTRPAPAAPVQTPPAPPLSVPQAPLPQQPEPRPVPPPHAPPTSRVAAAERQYSGHPISLDFQNGDLRTVLRLFSEISGLNMVIDPAVQGTLDIVLTDVPWDQALDIILRGNKLGYALDGTIVRIAPLSVLAQEEGERRKLAEEQALSGELQVFTRTVSYAQAADLVPLITSTALSQRGEVQVDARTNTLIIRDLPARLDTAAELIEALDRPEPQVEIEARIVQTSRDFARQIGIQWGLSGRVTPDIGNTTPLAFPNRGTVDGRTGAVQGSVDPRAGPLDNTGTIVNLPVPAANAAIGLALGSVNGAFNLDVALSALERSGRGRVLSTPRVTTQNNIEAEVTQGVQIPVQTVANNTVTVTFKDAALTLKVIPQITSANTVIMKIQLENATPDFSRSVSGIPPIDTQRALTQVQVDDGATTVIGGIFVSREQAVHDRTPFFHRVPLLGWLFRRDNVSDESRELLIFITPRIIRN